jgi:hypothetical protein
MSNETGYAPSRINCFVMPTTRNLLDDRKARHEHPYEPILEDADDVQFTANAPHDCQQRHRKC